MDAYKHFRCNREILILCDDGMLFWRRTEVEFEQSMRSGDWKGFNEARSDLEEHLQKCMVNPPMASPQA